jgi:transposase-like protein
MGKAYSRGMKAPTTFLEAVRYFSDPLACLEFLVALRWPRGVKCPQCGSKKVTFLANAKLWKCRNVHPKQKFSVKVGTIFEDSPIGLDKWFPAMWLAANCKNGISSYELHRCLGVTQKTAWFMLQRIRLAMQEGITKKFKGHVEADETFIGAKARNMHADKKRGLIKGGGMAGKTAVLGLLQRNAPEESSRVQCKIVERVRRHDIDSSVRARVEKGSTVYTDALKSYDRLADEYVHNVIDHAECYAKGHVHTNGLENFWSLLKRAIKGTYVNVEPFHLFRYLDEQAFRFNERKEDDGGRFIKVLRGVTGKGLRYAKLIGGDGIQQAGQTA